VVKIEELIPIPVIENYQNTISKYQEKQEFKLFNSSVDSLITKFERVMSSSDPRINCGIWAIDVLNLTNEILHNFIWLIAWADYFKSTRSENQSLSHSYFPVILHADNCITRINSCRDKIALMVWSYYCHFNPQNRKEVLTY
jgi:hypothetical protein